MCITTSYLNDHLELEIMNRAKVKDNCVMFELSDGTKHVFQFDQLKEELPSMLKNKDRIFYEKLCNEIFDELHPY